MNLPADSSVLGEFLEPLYRRYHSPRYLVSDPLEFLHRYRDPHDQEVVGLVSALLAYGNVKQIRRSVENLLDRMAGTPADFVRSLGTRPGRDQASRRLKGFVHRFNRDEDLLELLILLERSWRAHGSLGAHFLKHHRPEASDIGPALSGLIDEWRSWSKKERNSSFQYLLTSPADGSCCKRWCMLLRWFGRRDHLDIGLWDRRSPLASTFPHGHALDPSQLVIPLDTHTGRISEYLGLRQRKSLDWKAALEVTSSLREVDAEDPTRFDFALARLGILDLCQKKLRVEICKDCDLKPVCRFTQPQTS